MDLIIVKKTNKHDCSCNRNGHGNCMIPQHRCHCIDFSKICSARYHACFCVIFDYIKCKAKKHHNPYLFTKKID